jgi:predicted alpha/beta hydrolase family esterase
MFERSPHGDAESETHELSAYLAREHLPGPYILIAHSHGGAFAGCFLHSHPTDVAGMVMVETGQEATWNPKAQKEQEEHHELGHRPIVVIKGRSMLRKWKQLEEQRAEIKQRRERGEIVKEAETAMIMIQEVEIQKWEEMDEKLKRRQLKLSKKHKFVELTDVGHHVIRDKPEAVVEGVEWVMENQPSGSGLATPDSRRSSIEQPQQSRSGSVGGGWLRKVSVALRGGSKGESRAGVRAGSV